MHRRSTGPTTKAMRQLRCRREFDRVWSLFGLQTARLLAMVVLENMAVGPAAETLGITKPLASQKLVEALDVLVLGELQVEVLAVIEHDHDRHGTTASFAALR